MHAFFSADMVDEAKDTYVKNHLDLDTINEHKPLPEQSVTPAEKPTPSAPEDANSGGSGGADAGAMGGGEDPLNQV